MRRVPALALVMGLFVGIAVLAARQADASSFLGSIVGNVNDPQDLLLFDAIDDVSGIALLGSSEDDGTLSFPGADPAAGEGATTGNIVFTGDGTPLFFTVKAGKVTGLYSWMPSGGNSFDTSDLDPKPKGFSAARVWGNGPAIPEPTALLLFPLGLSVIGLAVWRRSH